MIGDVFSIIEKHPPVNSDLLVASYFDPNKLSVRYCVAKYNGHSFFSEKSEVLNVGFWAELKNISIITEIDFQKYQRIKLKKEALFWINKYDQWKDNFYSNEENIKGDYFYEEKELIQKFEEYLDL